MANGHAGYRQEQPSHSRIASMKGPSIPPGHGVLKFRGIRRMLMHTWKEVPASHSQPLFYLCEACRERGIGRLPTHLIVARGDLSCLEVCPSSVLSFPWSCEV